MGQTILRSGNVLDAKSDAIFLTVDGEMVVASEKQNDRRYGNIANSFTRRWPGVLDSERWYPLRYGDIHVIEPDEEYGCPFRLVVLASVLPHPHNGQGLNGNSLKTAVGRALQCMVDELLELGLSSCAMGLLKCGWRMDAKEALRITVDALNSPGASNSGVSVQVYVNDASAYEMLNSYAVSLGIEV